MALTTRRLTQLLPQSSATTGTSYQGFASDSMVWTTPLGRGNASFYNAQLDSARLTTVSPNRADLFNSQLQTIITSDLSRFGLSYTNTNVESLRFGYAGLEFPLEFPLVFSAPGDSVSMLLKMNPIQLDPLITNGYSRGNLSAQNAQLDKLIFNDDPYTRITLNNEVLDLLRLWDGSLATSSTGPTNYYNTILEQLKITDTHLTDVSLQDAVRDLLRVIDNDSLTITFYNSQLDQIVTSDLSRFNNIYNGLAIDSIVTNDLSRTQTSCNLSITDRVVANDGSYTNVTFEAVANDAVKLVDTITASIKLYSAVFDEVILYDVLIREGATRIYYVTFKLNLRSKTFKAHNHNLTMQLPKRGLTWEIYNRNLTVQSKNKNITFTLGG